MDMIWMHSFIWNGQFQKVLCVLGNGVAEKFKNFVAEKCMKFYQVFTYDLDLHNMWTIYACLF